MCYTLRQVVDFVKHLLPRLWLRASTYKALFTTNRKAYSGSKNPPDCRRKAALIKCIIDMHSKSIGCKGITDVVMFLILHQQLYLKRIQCNE